MYELRVSHLNLTHRQRACKGATHKIARAVDPVAATLFDSKN